MFKKIILSIGIFLSSLSFASADTVTVVSCDSSSNCSSAEIQAELKSLAGTSEKEFVVYNELTDKSYLYQTVNVTGFEFGFPIMKAILVRELPAKVTVAARNYIENIRAPIGAALDEISYTPGRIGGQPAYFLYDFYPASVTSETVKSQLNTIGSSIDSSINNSVANNNLSFTDNFVATLSIELGKVVSIGFSGTKIATKTFYLQIVDGENNVGLKISASYLNGSVEANITALVIKDNDGNVLLTISVKDNQVQTAELLQQSFDTTNPGGLMDFFESLNLSISWQAGCAICRTTITDLPTNEAP
jgi:hypothetical protein